MGLFNRSSEVVLSQGYWRRHGVPAWLMWLGSGVLLGALGLVWVQDRYGPQRLSVAESRELQTALDQEKAARTAAEQQARTQAADGAARLQAVDAELVRVRGDLERRIADSAGADSTIEQLRMDLALFDEVMPPDPRGNPVGVRAARLEQEGRDLRYHVLLTRDRKDGKPFNGVMQFVVHGQRASGATDSITLDAIPVQVGVYQHVKGTQALPQGFVPRQTAIRVLDKPEGNSVGMRIIHVQQG